MKSTDSIDLAFSFDCTGSMSTCIHRVRRNISDTVKYLFKEIPNLRIAIIAHGDYCDRDPLHILDFSSDQANICRFVEKVPNQGGGDSPEMYEEVLHKARTLNWTSGKNKALVMIGDEEPHKVGYYKPRTPPHLGRVDVDWKNEAGLLVEGGIKIYPIQALGRRNANYFYDGLASISETPKLTLEQFEDIEDIILAICMSRADKLAQLTIKASMSQNVQDNIDLLAGRKVKTRTKSSYAKDFKPVHPSRFQALVVRNDTPIKDFVQRNGLHFKVGRGFYEFTKPVVIQDYKEVIVQDKNTGDMYSGDEARRILGIPVGATAKVGPDKLTNFRGFVQSTSANRKLLSGTKFLYELEGF